MRAIRRPAGRERRSWSEPTTRELVGRWADEERSRSSPTLGATLDDQLPLDAVAVAEDVWVRCLGERGIGGLTLGDLALVPPALERAGLASPLAKRVCRSLGNALCAALARRAALPARGNRQGGTDAVRRLRPITVDGRATPASAGFHRDEEIMSERDEQAEAAGSPSPDDETGSAGYRIPGRDFAGASYASIERELARDHRGESAGHRADDAQNVGGEEQGAPRDES